jgi:GNAT superfamily N-acetyltransferase
MSEKANGLSDDVDPAFDRFYTLRLEIESELGDCEPPEAYVARYEGTIRRINPDTCRTLEIAGKVRAILVKAAAALNDDLSLFGDVMDPFDAATADCYSALCSRYAGMWHPRVARALGWELEDFDMCINGDILILDLITVRPKHRGQGLGIKAAHELIQLLGRGAQVVLCKPFPLQLQDIDHSQDSDELKRLALVDFPRDPKRATARLRAHWTQVGFRPLGRTAYLVLDGYRYFRPHE